MSTMQHIIKRAAVLICMAMVLTVAVNRAFAFQYFIQRPQLGIELMYEVEDDKRTGPNIDRKDTTTTYTERLDIETSGWAYHPALVVFNLTLSPEWEQIAEESSESDTRKSRDFLQGYNAEFTFLQYKPYTLTLFGNSRRSSLSSSFAERSRTDTLQYGARLILKYDILPTLFYYTHSETEQVGFYESHITDDRVNLDMKYDRTMGETNLNTSYMSYNQTTGTSNIDSSIKDIRLSNFVDLTEDRTIRLNSYMQYRDMSSLFSNARTFNWSEHLGWRHRKNLSTDYTLRYETADWSDSTREFSNAVFSVNHMLYENLATDVTIDVSKLASSGNKEANYETGVTLDYRRKIPWGHISINTVQHIKVTDVNQSETSAAVFDEAHVLTANDITLLNNAFVEVTSIIITSDPDDTSVPFTIYTENLDYRVTETGTFTRISKIITGNIKDNQTVLVDYSYRLNNPFDYYVYDQTYGISLNLWSSWTIYYRYADNSQKFLRGTEPDTLSSRNSRIVGTNIAWKWTNTQLEYEDVDSTELPLRRWRAFESIKYSPAQKVYLGLSGSTGKITYKDTGHTDRFWSARTSLELLVSSWGRFSIEGFTNSSSGPVVDIDDSGILSSFEWFFRIYNGIISYRYSSEEDNISGERFINQVVLFKIRRELF